MDASSLVDARPRKERNPSGWLSAGPGPTSGPGFLVLKLSRFLADNASRSGRHPITPLLKAWPGSPRAPTRTTIIKSLSSLNPPAISPCYRAKYRAGTHYTPPFFFLKAGPHLLSGALRDQCNARSLFWVRLMRTPSLNRPYDASNGFPRNRLPGYSSSPHIYATTHPPSPSRSGPRSQHLSAYGVIIGAAVASLCNH
jgi:hypothetical protein